MLRLRSTIRASFLAMMMFACLGQTNQAQAQSAFNLEGKSVDPLSSAQGKIVVLIFLRQDCPVSSRYAPVIQKISSEHKLDTNFWLVFPDKAESPAEIRKYLRDYGYQLPALRDPDHALVKRAQAEITPEAAVFTNDGHLIYHGRIDNWYVEFGRSRPAATTHQLSDAITAALAGKPLGQAAVKGVGCYISDLQ